MTAIFFFSRAPSQERRILSALIGWRLGCPTKWAPDANLTVHRATRAFLGCTESCRYLIFFVLVPQLSDIRISIRQLFETLRTRISTTMDVTDITPELDKLDVDLDELEELLKPLLSIGEVSSRLPLLDKAKLCVLASYTIESLLFCMNSPSLLSYGNNEDSHKVAASLRLNGVDAKNHAVFRELVRVRQYFEKIKKIETPPEPRPTSLDTTAAIRFLKADLVGSHRIRDAPCSQH